MTTYFHRWSLLFLIDSGMSQILELSTNESLTGCKSPYVYIIIIPPSGIVVQLNI